MKMPVFVTYESLLTQIFLNLINNAIKFNDKAEGHIHIGYEAQDGYYKFYVADDGPGIDASYHEKIFEIFQTLQSRDTIETTGIGLALVKKNVESQGGTVWVNSMLGKGSVFFFTWPK
jgi:signal transduction histidine kinase